MSRVNDELESMTRRNKIAWDQTYRLSDAYKTVQGRVYDSIEKDQEKLNAIIERKSKLAKSKIVKVLNAHPLDVAQIISEKNVRPLLINSGTQNDPMKIIESGPIGDEWELFRRSNICNAINADVMYPLRNGRVVYYPDITIFRSAKYDKLSPPFKIAVLSTAPVANPGIIQTQNAGKIVETYENIRDAERMQDRIERIFQIALLKNHNCVIINDFGCAQENPIQEIIKMFNDCIRKYPVNYVFFSIQEPMLDRLKRRDKKDYRPYVLFHTKINRHTYD